MNLEIGEYHAHDRWTFKRLDGGAVRIRRYDESGAVAAELVEMPQVWASIVSHVSARGETIDTYCAALASHNGAAK